MKFRLSKSAFEMLSGSAKRNVPLYPEWTQMYFTALYDLVNSPDSIGASGSFTNIATKEIENNVYGGFNRLAIRFEVDKEQVEDEKETLIRMLPILPADEYKALVNLLVKPYCHIELDKDSQKAIEEAFVC